MNADLKEKVVARVMPLDGIAGLKQNLAADMTSAFTVFLLALPLSLGIAKASEFPPIMGLISAIIGGILVGPIMGGRLTIKGPAAGLIVIVASAVNDFGGGLTGWHLACGAVFVAAALQVLFGIFKFGKYMDFFPLSAIHGMLAAIGIIIISKQIPILFNIDPALTKGKGPIELLTNIPTWIINFDPRATAIGVVCLAIMLLWSKVKGVLKKVPAPLIVIVVSVIAELSMDFQHTEPTYALLHIGSLMDNLNINIDFSGISKIGIFTKYVVMFALVGSLESLLTVKAIDMMDPYKRKSDTSKDMIALGIGNMFSSVLGGLPMISEVARSSANVNNGGKTRWANAYHGLFIAIFVIFFARYIEMIPNTALAAMLIAVGIKLAHPREFLGTYKIGIEQLIIFLVTIFFTLFEDLLIGIGMGILTKILIHLFRGVPFGDLFRSAVTVEQKDGKYLVEVGKSAIFTNYLELRNKLEAIPAREHVSINLSLSKVIDHSVVENIYHFKHNYEDDGGRFDITGLHNHTPVSNHKYAAMRKNKDI